MSNKTTEVIKDIGVGAGIGLLGVYGTVNYLHREKTHQSLVNKTAMRWFGKISTGLMGVNSEEWVNTHLIHHRFRDVNLAPIIETADALEYLADNPNVNVIPPTSFQALDRFTHLSPNQVSADRVIPVLLIEASHFLSGS